MEKKTYYHAESCYEDRNDEQLFDELRACKKKCLRLAKVNNVYTAYDFALRCSHAFNVLDARGALGKTERNRYIQDIQGLFNMLTKAIRASLDQ